MKTCDCCGRMVADPVQIRKDGIDIIICPKPSECIQHARKIGVWKGMK